MKLTFNIESTYDCEIIVTNTTSGSEYLQPTSNSEYSTSKLIKSESRCVVKLKKIPYNADEKEVVEYRIMKGSKATFEALPDGWYKLEAVVLPTLSYLKKFPTLWSSDFYYIDDQDKVYFYDFSKHSDENYIGEDVTNKNPFSTIFTYLENNSREDFSNRFFSFGYIIDYFSICNLLKCYMNYINAIFKGLCGNICVNRDQAKNDMIYRRDLVKMAIDIIKYLARCGKYNEANRILTQIYGCNGLCDKHNNPLRVARDCGCVPRTYSEGGIRI